MSSNAPVPSTPKSLRSPRKMGIKTPKSVTRKTILNFDSNESYMEEEDATFLYTETSTLSEGDDEDEFDEELEEDEFDLDDTDVEGDDDLLQEKGEPVPSTETEKDEETESESVSKFRGFIVKHEVPRKILHSSIGIFTLWLYTLGVNQRQLIVPLTTLFAIIFVNDYIRLQNPELNQKIVRVWWFLIREKEIDCYNGTLWYLAGLIIVFSLYPKDISLMGVLLLSWADTSASIIGRQFGKYTPQIAKGKSLAGSVASLVAGAASCYLLYGYFIPVYNDKVNVPGDVLWSLESSKLNLHIYAFLSGLIASVSEFINLYEIDDNFTIPVLSGSFLFGLVKFFEI